MIVLLGAYVSTRSSIEHVPDMDQRQIVWLNTYNHVYLIINGTQTASFGIIKTRFYIIDALNTKKGRGGGDNNGGTSLLRKPAQEKKMAPPAETRLCSSFFLFSGSLV